MTCRFLKVSTSGYHDWRDRAPPERFFNPRRRHTSPADDEALHTAAEIAA
ncbi:hypothetical protein NQ166_14135 [Microbacterium sp. zg.Y1090]|nr:MULTISPECIES: hypothetical protein [unclassified Microbacterium]MCR2819970.1 hypothetical protein [Microbacterium sp. zg.Y1090]MDL5488202.1 hypothetical protein [Microbacterium sp. zg-Y1211]WIM29300.1 hypothetical protein QNO26_05235 [Microbacterium sp. zg-Y1090]